MKKQTLFVRLLTYIFPGIVILLALVGFAYYQISATAIKNLTEKKTSETIQQSAQFVSSYVEKLEQVSSSLAQNSILLTYAKSPSDRQVANLKSLMETLLNTNSDLISATLVTKTGEIVSTDQSMTMQTSSDMMQEAWYMAAIAQKGMPVLTPARKNTTNQDKWVISVTQEIVDEQGQNLGVLRLDIDYGTMADYLNQLNLGKNGFTFIINQEHEFVYHPRKTVYSSKADMESMKPYIAVEQGYVTGKIFVSQASINHSEWTIIGVASLDELESIRQSIIRSMSAIAILAFLLSAGGLALLLRYWMQPLRDLQNIILRIGQGETHLRVQEKGSVELVDLAHHFNLMLDQIDRLVYSVQENEQAIRQYELQALASQINPHFLYNTLDTIVWMAEFNESKRVVEVTKSLATYFRLALNHGNEQIQLKSEIEHVRQYLFIQQQRYGDKLNYRIEELASYDDYLLPKLILQPLVENAIYHGIKEVNRPGEIRLRVYEDDNQLVISVYDNGQGFDSIMKEEARDKLVRQGGIGLSNVDKRLKLQFGEAYHMEWESQPDQFTEIRLYLPLNP